MRVQRFAIVFVLGMLFACMSSAGMASGQTAAPAPHEFTMTAKCYVFDPSVITVKKGEKVRLIITATDRDHGIKIKGYDIDQVLKKGDPTIIEFTADKVGTFEFKCSVSCGMGHHKMKGKLVVEEQELQP